LRERERERERERLDGKQQSEYERYTEGEEEEGGYY